MNRKEAHIGMQEVVDEECCLYGEELIDKIYDDFESRTCESCKHWNGAFYCNKFNMPIPHTPRCEDYGCNKWDVTNGKQRISK